MDLFALLLPKNRWKIKLVEFKIDQNTSSNKSENTKSLKKIIITNGNLSNKCAYSFQGFSEDITQVFLCHV